MRRMYDENQIKEIAGAAGSKLYRHVINYVESDTAVTAYITVISSKSLVVDSLTDLKTLLGNTFRIAATGQIGMSGGDVVIALTESGLVTQNSDYKNVGQGVANTYRTGTWKDTVTTI